MFRVPKIIHIVENLDRGAVENWLVRMFKHGLASGNSLDWTFYCILGKPGKLDEEELCGLASGQGCSYKIAGTN